MAIITSTVGTAGRNFSTLQAWEDSLPASAIVADNSYVAELYKDSEFAVALPLIIAGCATDATHTITVKAAAGQSFRDNTNVRTNALRYNAANGVAIRGTSGYNIAIDIQVPFVTLDGLQIAHTNNGRAVYAVTNSPTDIVVKNCICEAPGSFAAVVRGTGNNVLIQNVVIVNTGAGITLQLSGGAPKVFGATVVKTGTAGVTGVSINAATEMRNTVSANFATCFTGAAPANCSNNASTDATAPGTGSLTGLTLATLFEVPGTDYRTKAGAALIDAGTIAGLTFDISNNARPQGSAYDIGAWEVGAAATGTTLTPGAGAVAITGYAPSIAQARNIAPGAGSLAVTGYAPVVTQSNAKTIAMLPGSLALTGYAPTVAQAKRIDLSAKALAIQGYAPSVTQVAPVTLTLTRTAIAITGYAPTVNQGAIAPPASGGGGGGSVREVRKYASEFDRADKPASRAQKKARRRLIEVEALELLPDEPEAQAMAPIIAQLVYAQTAPAFASWTPVRAMQPLPPEAMAAIYAQVEAYKQQIALQEEIDDENDVELLLLG